MRKQYYFRPSRKGYFAWDVDRLVALTKNFQRRMVKLDAIREIDEPILSGDQSLLLTWRSISEDLRLIEEADLSYPIILSSEGRVMDGMHRVAKAMLNRHETIEAVQFTKDPEPDYEDVQPDDLSYERETHNNQ